MGKGLTRRDFLRGAGAVAIGLTLSGILPKKVLSQASGCPEYCGVAPVDFDYDTDSYRYMRPFYDRWLDEIKELGADTVEINIPVKTKADGSVGYNTYEPPYWLSPTFDEGTADSIKRYVRQAQQKGFKVILDIPSLMHDQSIDRRFNIDNFFREFEELSLKWAEIVEELGVEGYCPEGEFGAIEYLVGLQPAHFFSDGDWWLNTPRLAVWIKQLIPKIRQKYSGLITLQENPRNVPDVEFNDADYIGLHIHSKESEFVPGQTTRKFRSYINKHIQAADRVARRDGVNVMITEASFGAVPNVDGGVSPNNTVVNEQEQKELCEAFFQGVWGKTDGIFLWSWGSEPEFHRTLQVTDRPAEDVVRRYYQSC